MDALALEGVTVGYGRAPVLRDVSLSVARGERVALLGPNGAGKTTLLRAAGGSLRPDAGRVLVGAEDLAGMSARGMGRPTSLYAGGALTGARPDIVRWKRPPPMSAPNVARLVASDPIEMTPSVTVSSLTGTPNFADASSSNA